MGSKSTIYYGAKSTIKFVTTCVKEYFNIANINYYDVILGTPFLWRLNITLDFTSPGAINMGTTMVPRNLPPETGKGVTRVADHRSLSRKPSEWDQAGRPPARSLSYPKGNKNVTFSCQSTSIWTVASPHTQDPTAVVFRSNEATPLDYPSLQVQWMDKITNLISGVPPKVPPFHQINHEINPIDPNKWINYQLPKCPDTLLLRRSASTPA